MVSAQFKIYKSSAGSGKTFTLVKEYLGIVLREPSEYRHVLALTFTNKAAGEMKERILNELGALAAGKDSPMRGVLMEEFGIHADTATAHARQVLGNILHDYANFAVRTIDSFTHKLIRSFAKDLELPGRFDIEMDSKLMLQRTVDQLMDTIGRDEYVTDILVRFVEEKLRDQSGWRIETDLKEVGGELFKETSKPFLAAIRDFDHAEFPHFIEMLRERKRAFPDHMKELARKALDIAKAHGVSAQDFANGARGVYTKLEKLIHAKKPTDIQNEMESTVMAEAATQDKWMRKGDSNPRMEAALSGGLRDAVQELWQYHQEQFEEYVTVWHAFQNVHSLAVMQQIEDLVEAYKAQYNLVHISDFQPKIEQFIRDEAPDYIYWRLGERYWHYMLDEFQDTSLLQWLNLHPLVENLQSGGHGKSGSLLIVGDSKQAIYRWRGGETSLMELLVPEQLGVTPMVLGRNFRSHEYVVDFNNRFFEEAVKLLSLEQPDIELIYSDLAQTVRPGNEALGFVRIELVEPDDRKYAEVAYERTLELVRSLLEQGYQYRDIAILVRTRDEGSQIAEVLGKEGVRVISAESILLYKSPVVNFLVSLFRFMFDPVDAIPRAEVLHYFFHHLHPDTDWGVDPNLKIRELLSDEHPIQSMLEVLPRELRGLMFRTDRLSLYELTEEVVRIFGLNVSAPAFVQHFLDVVLEFSERRKPDLGAFLEFWDEKKEGFSLIVPSGEDAVEIQTIHKSKGLEYPVVIIPKADWSTVPKPFSTIWASSGELFGEYPGAYLIKPQAGLEQSSFGETYQEELRKTLLDNLNLLYVAFTRAKERLYILAPDASKTVKSGKGKDELKNVGAIIRRIMNSPGFRGMDANIYETGFPLPPKAREKAAASPTPPRLITTQWRDRIRIDRKARKYWEATPEGHQSDGPMMAEVLRNLQDSSGLGLALERLLEAGMIDQEAHERLSGDLEAFLKSSPVADWYAVGRKARTGMRFLFSEAEPLSVDRVLPGDAGHVLVFIVDESRDQFDAKAARSCVAFLEEQEGVVVEAWRVRVPSLTVTRL